jgi:hypothetical protein
VDDAADLPGTPQEYPRAHGTAARQWLLHRLQDGTGQPMQTLDERVRYALSHWAWW